MFILKLKKCKSIINNMETDNQQFAIDLLNKFGPKLRNLIKNELIRIEKNSE